MPAYGPRDAVSIVMDRGHKVARRWRAAGMPWLWTLDGTVVSLADIEDLADSYEPCRYRHTARDAPTGPECGLGPSPV